MPASGDCPFCHCSRVAPGPPGKCLCCASSSVGMEKGDGLVLTPPGGAQNPHQADRRRGAASGTLD